MNIEENIDQLVVYFTQAPFDKEVAEAKNQFFDQAGSGDDINQFELRMSQFLDWYLFSRDLSDVQVRPVDWIIESPPNWMTPEMLDFCRALTRIQHSLFEFIKIRNRDVYLKNLFTGKKVVLRDSPVSVGFSNEEIIEARLVPIGDNFHFTKGFCFHPQEAKKFILKEIKKVKQLEQSEHDALMMKLLKMRYKHEQYAHIRIDYIYTNDPKMRPT
jgi:hypothetical protein